MQALNVTRPSDFWLNVLAAGGDPLTSPHGPALFTDITPVDTFVDCSEYSETVSLGAGEYPALADMLCSLVLQGNKAHADEGAVAPAGSPSGVEAEVEDGEPPAVEADVTEATNAAPAWSMEGVGCVAFASLIAMVAELTAQLM